MVHVSPGVAVKLFDIPLKHASSLEFSHFTCSSGLSTCSLSCKTENVRNPSENLFQNCLWLIVINMTAEQSCVLSKTTVVVTKLDVSRSWKDLAPSSRGSKSTVQLCYATSSELSLISLKWRILLLWPWSVKFGDGWNSTIMKLRMKNILKNYITNMKSFLLFKLASRI